jgi:hypothetical protein
MLQLSQKQLDVIVEHCSREGLKGNLVLAVRFPTTASPMYAIKKAEWTHGWDIDPQ